MKKKKSWCKFRHRVVTALIRPFVFLAAAVLYHARIDRFAAQGKRNYLVLSNHQTDFDQFFIGLAFRGPVYYLALEDLFSKGFLSRVISWLIAPIPIQKATSDVKAVITCLRVAREGGNIAIFPEGNRTYSGHTCHIEPSIATMALKLGLPIAIFRIEGGYGVKPRWADRRRKGTICAGVRRVIEPEEYRALNRQQLHELLCRELWVDECAEAASDSPACAEYLERALYVCPRCGLSELETAGEHLTCTRCGAQYRYGAGHTLHAVGDAPPLRTVAEWYDHQEAFIRSLDLSPYQAKPMYCDCADVSEVIVYDRKRPLLKNAQVRLFADRLELLGGDATMSLPYSDIRAMACITGHKLNVFYQSVIYQLQGGKRFNALKYCNIYYHAKFVNEEHTDGEFQFLGL